MGLGYVLIFVSNGMDEGDEREKRRKNSTEKINPATWFSILEPEKFTSALAQEETPGEKIFPTPPQPAGQTYETNILLPEKVCFKSQAQMI